MEKSEVLKKWLFLEKCSACSFFVLQGGQILISEDQLECIAELEKSWLQTEGNYNLNGRLVFNIASERDGNRNYILVIPQQEAMLRLRELRIYIWILIFAVAVAGTTIAMHDGGEGQVLFEFGVEGVHWEQDGDNVKMLPSLSDLSVTLNKCYTLPSSRITQLNFSDKNKYDCRNETRHKR